MDDIQCHGKEIIFMHELDCIRSFDLKLFSIPFHIIVRFLHISNCIA